MSTVVMGSPLQGRTDLECRGLSSSLRPLCGVAHETLRGMCSPGGVGPADGHPEASGVCWRPVSHSKWMGLSRATPLSKSCCVTGSNCFSSQRSQDLLPLPGQRASWGWLNSGAQGHPPVRWTVGSSQTMQTPQGLWRGSLHRDLLMHPGTHLKRATVAVLSLPCEPKGWDDVWSVAVLFPSQVLCLIVHTRFSDICVDSLLRMSLAGDFLATM